ncbi:hypothetical protein GJ496_004931 [Pomphorhynchus laevis]|nr:hypothetical protein GJ496_004931 [Pomphorhynchus laevis]
MYGGSSDLCAACRRSFGRSERRTVFNGKQYHQKCLVCVTCQQPLAGAFYPTDDGFQCESCHGRVSVRCYRCGDVIRGNVHFKVMKGHQFHDECLVCCSCGKVLSDEQQTHNSEDLHELDGYPQCNACYNSNDRRKVNLNYGPAFHDTIIVKKCAKCKCEIAKTELFYAYEDIAFHKECFTCNRCGVNLVGKSCHRLASAVVCPKCS